VTALPSFTPATVPGAGLVTVPWHTDRRGSFTKPFSPDVLRALGSEFHVAEVYWSGSATGTIRGMHLQAPPHALRKLVFVVAGRIRDVVVDVRRGSPTYGQIATWDLEPSGRAVLVPSGCAHGFEVLEGPAAMCYVQDGGFDAETDGGVRWDSVGAPWTTAAPLVSDRDAALPRLDEYESPFVWEAT